MFSYYFIALIFLTYAFEGNTLVLIVLFKFPCKKFVPINWLLCHLALSDFIMGGTVFFWYGIAEITQIPVKNEAKVKFRFVKLFIKRKTLLNLTIKYFF